MSILNLLRAPRVSSFSRRLFSASSASILAKRAVLTTILVVSDGPGTEGVPTPDLSSTDLDTDDIASSSDVGGSSCT